VSLEIRWTANAEREASRLDPPVSRRIVAALERYAATGHGDTVRLTDVEPTQYRLRVGEWRVRFTVDREARALYILSVQPRGRAYR
jgi:mRNA interferase RelE/StbE